MNKNSCQVLVIGPNPALDVVLETPTFVSGAVNRATRALHLAGGKPIIVARTLRRLGIAVRVVSPLGGDTGPRRVIVDACRSLGIELRVCEVREETRICVIVADPESGESSVVNEPGPCLSLSEAANYTRMVEEALTSTRLVLTSGSLPPGLDPDFYAQVARRARQAEVPAIVDTSGEPLRLALEAGPWCVKVNRHELLSVVGGLSVAEAARQLAARVEHVVVTLGAEGALYAGSEGMFRLVPAPMPVTNATGAGDAFLAGLAAELVQETSWLHALRTATAISALVCDRIEPDIGPDPDVGAMLETVRTMPA